MTINDSDDTASGSGHADTDVEVPVVTVGQLQDVLSPAAFGQLERLRDVDFCRVDYQFLETEFADALRELEHVESVTAALFRALLEMKRTQVLHSNRMVELEDEIQGLHASLSSLAQPTKIFNAQAEGQLRKERKELAEFKTYVAERMDMMQTSLGKAERNVDLLQTRCTANKDTMEEVVMELFPMKELAKFLATEFSEMHEHNDVIWGMVMRLQERIHDLALDVDHEGSAYEVPDEERSAGHRLSLEAEILRDASEEASSSPSSLSLIIDTSNWLEADLESRSVSPTDGGAPPPASLTDGSAPRTAASPSSLGLGLSGDGGAPPPASSTDGSAPPPASLTDGSAPRTAASPSSLGLGLSGDGGAPSPAPPTDGDAPPPSPGLGLNGVAVNMFPMAERIFAILSLVSDVLAGSRALGVTPLFPTQSMPIQCAVVAPSTEAPSPSESTQSTIYAALDAVGLNFKNISFNTMWHYLDLCSTMHLDRDARTDGEARKTEAAISSTILLTTAGELPSQQASSSRSSHTRDRDWMAGQEEHQNTNVLAVESSSSSHARDQPGISTPDVVNPSTSSAGQGHGTKASDHADRLKPILTGIVATADNLGQTVPPNMSLTFRSQPTTLTDPVPEPNEGAFVSFYLWLEEQRRYVVHIQPTGDLELDTLRMTVLEKLDAEITKLDTMKGRAWSRLVTELIIGAHRRKKDGPLHIKSDILERRSRTRKMQPFILAGLIMASILHSLAAASRLCSDYILATLQVVIFGAFVWSNTQTGQAVLTPGQEELLTKVPDDMRTVFKDLELEPDLVRYACCPKCASLYSPDPQKPDDPYPHTCTFQETDQPVCGTTLVYKQDHAPTRKNEPGKVTYEPVLVYPYRKVETWLMDLVSRRGLVERMRAAWSSVPGRWRDIFHAPAVRTFLGPDRKTLFSAQPDNTVHIVFSLFIDWFNPFGNKKAGKSHSVGAIYLICENLPDHLRYRPEYMCLLSIIPGPKEPTLHWINHLLRPLVDELLVLWHRGILFENVSPDHVAVLVRAAVIPLVCDLPALRKAAGFAGHMAAHFCSFCQLLKDRINDLDRSHWPTRSWSEHLRLATKWKEAPTDAVRATEFKEHGIRWSELLRLEYWDPTQFAVVDAMHNLLLGDLRHHCRDVWGLDVKDKASDSSKAQPHTPEQQRAQLLLVEKAITNQSKNTWGKIRKGYVVAVAEFNGISPKDASLSKAAYVNALLEHFASSSNPGVKLPPVLDDATADFHLAENPHDISKHRIIDQPTIKMIREDISNTTFPSWMERPLRNFGSPSHGKLKADQWRTVGTVSLVITLCRLWGSSKASDRSKLLLDNFLALVCAVDLATRRSMDIARAEKFDSYMMHYLRTLRSVFRHHLVPNHHLSLHLRQCLLLFGPVHAWWTFPFERYNGILQQLNTNNKTKDMPLTFMRYFHIGCTLRWLMDTIEWPTSLPFKKMVSTYHEAVKSVRAVGLRIADFIPFGLNAPEDTRLQDYNEKKEEELPRELYDSLLALISSFSACSFSSAYAATNPGMPVLPVGVNNIGSIDRNGVRFATRKTGLRDSFVLFDDPLADVEHAIPLAGQIAGIFLHGRREEGKVVLETFLWIDEYRPLDPGHTLHDPYRRFPDINTWLCYNVFQPTPRLVRPQNEHKGPLSMSACIWSKCVPFSVFRSSFRTPSSRHFVALHRHSIATPTPIVHRHSNTPSPLQYSTMSSQSPAVQMTLAGTEYIGQIVHSAPAASVVAWGYPDIETEGGVFISFNPQVYIFKTSSSAEINLFLVLHGAEHDDAVLIDLKENILMQDSERPNVLACAREVPSGGVRITFEDVESAEDFEVWMHAALLEVAAQEDEIPLGRLIELLARPEGLEYDEERDIFPGLERLAEEIDAEASED
ncbi:hypothetical protein GSI_05714 [Ganoderma sinense ZZ0214-1]|uniref:Uncharacterized protein n=1 Tax=Ganoderma sinense ZZ0214-1 TaxID=1077348 RepID=A0A2G8SB86_9APHY|nr:hypothetical protein GSI_05714 [Ganoderma sinense ZZ0214-1]